MDATVHRIAASDIAAPDPPDSDAVVIHLRGDIDAVTCAAVDVLLSHAATGPGDELVVDLSRVVFMDCAGLRPLLTARERLLGRMWLQHPSGQVRMLLDVTGLWAAFEVIERSVGEVVAFTPEPERAALSLALATSPTDELELRLAGLQEAMRSRAVIEQAKGLLMGTHRCSANTAFQRLAQASQDHHVQVRDICAALVAGVAGGGSCPPGPDVAAALRAVMRVRVAVDR